MIIEDGLRFGKSFFLFFRKKEPAGKSPPAQ
jgi:hypothetical protein